MNVLTFDIEDWFHVIDNPATDKVHSWASLESRVAHNTDRILLELSARGVKATFFCLGWVAESYPELIRRIAAEGHELGSHSYAHRPVYEQDRETFQADLVRSIGVLEDVSGTRIQSFRAPGFSITRETPWAFNTLVENGITVDCSIFPARCPHGGWQHFCEAPSSIKVDAGVLREFPMSLRRILGVRFACSGGGYFRLLPFPLIRGHFNKSSYSMSYFHPRDFDPSQPTVTGLSVFRKLKARAGLSTAMFKLRRMLEEFDFVNVGRAVDLVDWSHAPSITPQHIGCGQATLSHAHLYSSRTS